MDIARIGVDPVVGERTPVDAIATHGLCHKGYDKLTMTELAGSASTGDKMLRKGFTSGPFVVSKTICSAPFDGVDKRDANGVIIPKGRGVLNHTNKGVLGEDGMNNQCFCVSRTRDPQSDCFEGIISEAEGDHQWIRPSGCLPQHENSGGTDLDVWVPDQQRLTLSKHKSTPRERITLALANNK